MIAYCGLNCRKCQIYLATRLENKEEQAGMRSEIARLCREHYGIKCAHSRPYTDMSFEPSLQPPGTQQGTVVSQQAEKALRFAGSISRAD